jgi:drug/metabolite transporter (DMT)-like permease
MVNRYNTQMSASKAPLGGVFMVLLGTVWFSAMSLFIKALGPDVPVSWVALIRSAVMIPFVWVFLRKEKISIKSKNGLRLFLRGFWGASAMVCVFWALPRMPIAEASVLFYASPLYSALWGTMFMGEKLDKTAIICIGVAFLGVYVTFRPELAFDSMPYYAALAAGILSSLAFATIKSLASTEPALRIIFYFGVVASAIFLPGAITSGFWPDARQWGLLLLVGLSASIGQLFLTTGISRAPVSKASFGALFNIVLNMLGGWLIWHETPDAITLLGCLLVTGGILGLTQEMRRRFMVTIAQ